MKAYALWRTEVSKNEEKKKDDQHEITKGVL